MADIIKNKRGTAAAWTAANPVLADGQIGVEKDANPKKIKIGDGVTAWNSLPYVAGNTVNTTNNNTNITGGNMAALSAYDSAEDALADVGATPVTFLLDEDKTVSTDLDFPTTAKVLPTNGARFVKSGSGKMTFADSAIIGDVRHQIFEGFEPGDIVFDGGNPVRPEWWGEGYADQTSGFDSSEAFQCAIASRALVKGVCIELAAKGYRIANVTFDKMLYITCPSAAGISDGAVLWVLAGEDGLVCEADDASPAETIIENVKIISVERNLAVSGNTTPRTGIDACGIRSNRKVHIRNAVVEGFPSNGIEIDSSEGNENSNLSAYGQLSLNYNGNAFLDVTTVADSNEITSTNALFTARSVGRLLSLKNRAKLTLKTVKSDSYVITAVRSISISGVPYAEITTEYPHGISYSGRYGVFADLVGITGLDDDYYELIPNGEYTLLVQTTISGTYSVNYGTVKLDAICETYEDHLLDSYKSSRNFTISGATGDTSINAVWAVTPLEKRKFTLKNLGEPHFLTTTVANDSAAITVDLRGVVATVEDAQTATLDKLFAPGTPANAQVSATGNDLVVLGSGAKVTGVNSQVNRWDLIDANYNFGAGIWWDCQFGDDFGVVHLNGNGTHDFYSMQIGSPTTLSHNHSFIRSLYVENNQPTIRCFTKGGWLFANEFGLPSLDSRISVSQHDQFRLQNQTLMIGFQPGFKSYASFSMLSPGLNGAPLTQYDYTMELAADIQGIGNINKSRTINLLHHSYTFTGNDESGAQRIEAYAAQGNGRVYALELDAWGVGASHFALRTMRGKSVFGGTTPATDNAFNTRVLMRPISSTGESLIATNWAGDEKTKIDKNGTLATKVTTEPADADIDAGELFYYFDSTNGAAKVKFKGKSADGSVVEGEISLT